MLRNGSLICILRTYQFVGFVCENEPSADACVGDGCSWVGVRCDEE